MKSQAEREFTYQRAKARNGANFERWFMPALRRDISIAERSWNRFEAFARWVVSRNVLTYHDIRRDWPERDSQEKRPKKLDMPDQRLPSEAETIATAQAFLGMFSGSSEDDSTSSSLQTLVEAAGWGTTAAFHVVTSPAELHWQQLQDGLCANPQLLQYVIGVPKDDPIAFASAIVNAPDTRNV